MTNAPSTKRQYRRRRNSHVTQQRKVEREFRKKYYKYGVLEDYQGELLPPTLWNYRKALVFSAAGAQDRGIEELLTTRVGPGSYRTQPSGNEHDH